MLSTIHTAMSGLESFTNGLQTISSNVANMNTPGFLGSQARFSNLFESGRQSGGGGGAVSLTPVLNLKPGAAQPTGNPLDVAPSGDAFFVTRGADGAISYTRNGRFHIDSERMLATTDGSRVLAMGAGGLSDFDVSAFQVSKGVATSKISFAAGAQLSTNRNPPTTPYTTTVTIFDEAGGSHKLTLTFQKAAGNATSFSLTVKEGDTVIKSDKDVIQFQNGKVTTATSTATLEYLPAGLPPQNVEISFANIAAGAFSTSATLDGFVKVDGRELGNAQSAIFDESGKLIFSYSNGAKEEGPTLALALLDGATNIEQVSEGRIRASGLIPIGAPGGEFGSILPQQISGSNVELSREFGAIIVDQRGYQACSQVISTANEMLETLLRMKSGA